MSDGGGTLGQAATQARFTQLFQEYCRKGLSPTDAAAAAITALSQPAGAPAGGGGGGAGLSTGAAPRHQPRLQ